MITSSNIKTFPVNKMILQMLNPKMTDQMDIRDFRGSNKNNIREMNKFRKETPLKVPQKNSADKFSNISDGSITTKTVVKG